MFVHQKPDRKLRNFWRARYKAGEGTWGFRIVGHASGSTGPWGVLNSTSRLCLEGCRRVPGVYEPITGRLRYLGFDAIRGKRLRLLNEPIYRGVIKPRSA